jgi:hypothetical protein
VKIYKFLSVNVYSPLQQNLYVIVDNSTKMVSYVMKILKENQVKLIDHITRHYENVQVLIHDNWMRLDFNKDGHVTLEDLK